MADLFTIEDKLHDVYSSILPPEFPLVWSDQEMPELEDGTYVTIELEDLQQIGSAYFYPTIDHPTEPDKLLSRSKLEFESPLVFTALGPDAKKALLHIQLSKSKEFHRSTLVANGIAIRGNGSGVRTAPQIVGSSNVAGATLTFDIGIGHIQEDIYDYIEKTEVTTQEIFGLQPPLDDQVNDYLIDYNYHIRNVLKDYHGIMGSYDHIINLGTIGDFITDTHDAGTLP